MIDTREKLLRALSHLYPNGFEGLDPAHPTPTNYAEYTERLLPGYAPHSEAELDAALVAWQVAKDAAVIQRHRESLVLTRAQFGELLIRKGRKAEVDAILNSISDPTQKAIMLEWYEYAPHVRRLAPKVEAIRVLLDPPVSEATADGWFEEAMGYE